MTISAIAVGITRCDAKRAWPEGNRQREAEDSGVLPQLVSILLVGVLPKNCLDRRAMGCISGLQWIRMAPVLFFAADFAIDVTLFLPNPFVQAR
jgi:hypothetical protein